MFMGDSRTCHVSDVIYAKLVHDTVAASEW